MRAIERTTDLPLSEIRACLAKPEVSELPSCRLLNDIGAIAVGNSGESAEAQEALAVALNDEPEKNRWIAIRFLCTLDRIGKATSATKEAIATFKAKKKNKKIFPSPREMDEVMSEPAVA